MINFKDLERGDTVYVVVDEEVVEDTFKRVENIGYHGSGLDVAYLKNSAGHFLQHGLYETRKEATEVLLKIFQRQEEDYKKNLKKVQNKISSLEPHISEFEVQS